jgi:ferric-chelate reductase
MGWLAWSEAHPFTIASGCANAAGDGMVLMIKKTGGWSRKLYDIGSKPSSECEARPESRVRVIVEGPYGTSTLKVVCLLTNLTVGGPGHTVFSSFSGALLVVGGSGISFGLAAAQELVQRAVQGTSNVRTIELVWTTHHACTSFVRSLPPTGISCHIDALNPLLPLFKSLLEQSSSLPLTLFIKVFYTRATTSDDKEQYMVEEKLPTGLSLYPGRAWIPEILTAFISSTTVALSQGTVSKGNGVLVGACGPASLSNDVRRAITMVGTNERETVGGVELHEE